MPTGDNQEVVSRRESVTTRLKNRYPDKDFADDESVFGQISDDYDDYDAKLKGYEEREKKFSDMFTADPRSAHFLANWRDGGDPVVELVRQFGSDIKYALDDPERQEAIAKANQEFVERVAEEKKSEETYQQNLAESLKALEQWQAEKGLSDDEVDEVMNLLIGVVRDGILGKFTAESMDMALKAKNHDTDVEDASQEGEVRGRNARIDERLRRRSQSDGLSNMSGRNTAAVPQQKPRQKNPFVDADWD